MAGYLKYSDSGIPWLGEYPAHWTCCRVKNSFFSTKTVVGEVADSYERLALTLNGVIKRSKIDAGGLQPERFETYQILRENELVFKLIDLQNVSTSRIGRSPYTGIVSPAYIILHERNNRSTRYAEYYFLSMWMHQVFNQLGADGVRSNIGAAALLDIPFLLPPEHEQESIATFLDEKITRIDAIISEAKASIEEYKAWKASIIYEAVTKGLDSNVEMKDSGIEWIGQIPEHWKKCKIKQVADAYNGDRSSNYPSGDDIVTEGVPFITSNNLNTIVLTTQIEKNKFITEEKYNSLRGAKLQLDDIVFCLRGSVGKCSINKQYSCGTIASSLVVFRARNIHPDYLNYVLQNNVITEMALTSAIGIGSLNLSAENIMSFPIAIPPLEEQRKIAEILNTKCHAIELIISEKEELVADLEAYKKSLIFEVVTGKRKVV